MFACLTPPVSFAPLSGGYRPRPCRTLGVFGIFHPPILVLVFIFYFPLPPRPPLASFRSGLRTVVTRRFHLCLYFTTLPPILGDISAILRLEA